MMLAISGESSVSVLVGISSQQTKFVATSYFRLLDSKFSSSVFIKKIIVMLFSAVVLCKKWTLVVVIFKQSFTLYEPNM